MDDACCSRSHCPLCAVLMLLLVPSLIPCLWNSWYVQAMHSTSIHLKARSYGCPLPSPIFSSVAPDLRLNIGCFVVEWWMVLAVDSAAGHRELIPSGPGSQLES